MKLGDKAPTFKVKNQNGDWVQLKDFLGKKVVIYFYPKDMTPGCTRESCDFQENLNQIQKKGAVILGVSFDDEKRHKKFIEKYNLEFDLLVDSQKEMAKAYGVFQKKKFMGLEFMGIVRSTFLIDEGGKIARVWSPVSVKGHVAEVVAALS